MDRKDISINTYTKRINPDFKIDPEIIYFDHPFLTKIISIENQSIVMEKVEGITLEEYINKNGVLKINQALKIFYNLACALDYLHNYKSGYLFLDLKPANIIIYEDKIKLIDIDTCMSIDYISASTDIILPGTKGFAAPEQYSLKSFTRKIDFRADIYSLGVTMFNLITAVDPKSVEGNHFSIRKYKHLSNKSLDEIILKCTRVNPEGRYKDVKELLYDLAEITNL